jgi:hypothetical protein
VTTTCPFCGAAFDEAYGTDTRRFACGTFTDVNHHRHDQTALCSAAEGSRLTKERDEALAEVARLKAGGCARDQRTTQWCAEAVALQGRVKMLQNQLNATSDAGNRNWDMYTEALERVKRLEAFANRFLHPEDLGFTVTAWIRDDAREALGMPAVETKAKEAKP